ncbi:cathelicidin-6-like isoform X1 [Sminthopsis crassicaudata]|uniref:cathelicidin-6-like isoform X1 n=1 Tax=Sminthopsis crassicaudata TaxID=9301 RepID=UPI003D69FC7F
MERGWIMWLPPLLLLFLSMVTPFAPAQTLSYRNLVNRFIINYNKKSVSGNLFRLLALNLPPGINNDPSIPHPLNFTIMETVCPKTKPHNLDECNFKENGLVKECYGTISLEATRPSINISCGKPGELKSEDFLDQIIQDFRNFISQKYRQLRDEFRGLRDILFG